MKQVLIGDVGGTNARFALLDAKQGEVGYRDELVLQAADFDSPEVAIEHYLAEAQAGSPDVICIAAAGPVAAGAVELTNNAWQLREASLQSHFGARVALLNDFEAVARSLPALGQAHIAPVGSPSLPALASADFTLGVVGPGTGLGAAGLVRRSGHESTLTTEAGHNGFAPESKLQGAVRDLLHEKFGRVSDERLVSGAGLINIYTALAQLQGAQLQGAQLQGAQLQGQSAESVSSASTMGAIGAADIFAEAGSNPLAKDAVNLFFEVLGQVAGNFALAIGAWDGIYIAGGIVQRYPELMAASGFRAGFENKGRHRRLMEGIPTAMIQHRHPGLLGAAAVARTL